ncbi:MAG: phosphoglycerate kinase [Parcubacteria group bacterium]|nr:phosphoglycerate kinase [Parcubacteria group bacterium]
MKEHLDVMRGKRVLLRIDTNVPVKDGRALDDFRLQKILSTIDLLRKARARVLLLGHIGRDGAESLRPVFEYFLSHFSLSFIEHFSDDAVWPALNSMTDGGVVLFENARGEYGETENDMDFAKRLASFADIYVNEAFSVSHRAHASIVSVPKLLPSYAGPLLISEMEHLSRAFHPPRPFVFVLGGIKFETKLPLIEKFLDTADYCFVGGALAHSFFKARGYEIGKSIVDDGRHDIKTLLKNKKLILPVDVVVQTSSSAVVKKPNEILPDEIILDAGPETLKRLEILAQEARFLLWNGPLGDYLQKGFEKGTEAFVRMLAAREFQDGELVVGGGDTAAMISELGLIGKFPFISTGGGAMLEFLANGTLQGIEALKNHKRYSEIQKGN